jgi:hypothetical protein
MNCVSSQIIMLRHTASIRRHSRKKKESQWTFEAETEFPLLCSACCTNLLSVIVLNLQHKQTAYCCAQLATQTDCLLLRSTCNTNRLPIVGLNLQHKQTAYCCAQLATQTAYCCAQLATQTDCLLLCSTCNINRLPIVVLNLHHRLPIVVLNLQHKQTAHCCDQLATQTDCHYCTHFAAHTDCPLLCATCNTNRLPIIVYNTHYSSFISLHR